LQLSTYAYMIEKKFGVPLRALHVVHLPQDGSSIAYRCSYYKNEVQEMVKTWLKTLQPKK
jgi:hypothetical protein